MRVLIVGFGSIGQRHYENLRHIDPEIEITIWRQHTKTMPETGNSECRIVHTLDEALQPKPDCALICNPASQHIQTALSLAKEGIHLFIEKPISDTLEDVDALVALCKQKRLTLMVGYNFRFYKPLQMMRSAILKGKVGRILNIRAEIGQYLPDWRPERDYRESVSAKKTLGGGALLELSHELDYVRWIVGEVEQVYCLSGHVSDLEMDVDDMAEIVLKFQDGIFGSVHLDMVQRTPFRLCRVIGTDGTIEWNANSHQVRLFSVFENGWQDLHPAMDMDRNEMYDAELKHFFGCIQGRFEPFCSGEDGLRVLQIVLAAKKSSAQNCAIRL